MKKFILFFLITVHFSFFSLSASADETAGKATDKTSIIMAVNEESVIVNGARSEITAPVLVFDKTYVDLYAVASLLNIKVNWVEAHIGYFKVSTNDTTCNFTLIQTWEDLLNQKHKFFVKDSKIFVSLRELSNLGGYDITYDNGIITIGNQSEFNKEIFGEASKHNINDYVYKTYPVGAEYVVNPYQEYSYETMLEDTKKLQRMYPELIKTSSIGKSVEGRDLLLIEFGRGPHKIFVCATHHAREYITTTYAMYAIDRYAYAYRTGSMWGKYNPAEILNNITFCIVPMVNPDGVNLVQNGLQATKEPEIIADMGIYESPQYGYSAWKANMNGVDLNWNYNKDWSEEKNKNPRGSAGFTGDRPGTEPETIAVSDYVDNNVFEAFLSLHTQGEIFYWADNRDNPSNINELIRRDTGFVEYSDTGTGNGGSFFDYVYRKFNKPTITLELCPYVGNYPFPNEKFDIVWTPAKNAMLIIGNEIIYKLSESD